MNRTVFPCLTWLIRDGGLPCKEGVVVSTLMLMSCRAAAPAASILLFAKVCPTLNSESESATGKLKGSLDVLASGDKHNQAKKTMVKPRVIIQ